MGNRAVEFIEANNPEWCDMWEELSQYKMNKGDPICLFMGTCWEYMGSSADHHHFRHLNHPASGKSEFAYVERRQRTTTARLNWAS